MFGDYCNKCGTNLKCFSCNGTGRVKNLLPKPITGTYCCGLKQYGNYCTNCGGSLKPLFEPPIDVKCVSCNGTGRSYHFCRGY